jgi:hypothetical protein
VKNVLGESDYRAKANVCTRLNGVYWLETVGQRSDGLVVVSNFTEGAKRKVENVHAARNAGATSASQRTRTPLMAFGR